MPSSVRAVPKQPAPFRSANATTSENIWYKIPERTQKLSLLRASDDFYSIERLPVSTGRPSDLDDQRFPSRPAIG